MPRRPNRGVDSLGRKREVRRILPRMLILCEGPKTERQYLQGLIDHFKAHTITVPRCKLDGLGKDPLTIIKRAIEMRKQAELEGESDPFKKYDSVWCVVDVDDHKTLPDAIDLARKESVGLAVSNPCFEIWLLLHFTKFSKHATSKALGRELKKYIKDYDKSISATTFPWESHKEATSRAKEIAPGLTKRGIAGPNPSSSVWILVNEMQNVRRR